MPSNKQMDWLCMKITPHINAVNQSEVNLFDWYFLTTIGCGTEFHTDRQHANNKSSVIGMNSLVYECINATNRPYQCAWCAHHYRAAAPQESSSSGTSGCRSRPDSSRRCAPAARSADSGSAAASPASTETLPSGRNSATTNRRTWFFNTRLYNKKNNYSKVRTLERWLE